MSAHAATEELFVLKEVVTGLLGNDGMNAVTMTWKNTEKKQPAGAKFTVPTTDAPNVNGARDVGFAVGQGNGHAADTSALRTAIASGRVKAVYVVDPGPDGSLGDVSWLTAARRDGAISLLVVQGVVMSELAAAADIVLPGERRPTPRAASLVSDVQQCPAGDRECTASGIRRRRQGAVHTADSGAKLAAGVEPLGTLEVGLPVSGSAAREGAQRPDGRRRRVHSSQAGGITVRALVATVALLLVFSQIAGAQLRGVKAELTPLVESDAAPGASVRAALQVRIPDRFHVQSDAPRDPTLIPTVLTVDAPEGVKVTEIVFPQATEFNQIGQAQPLLVFEHEFAIGVGLEISSTVPGDRLEVPGHLRYQACDDRLCYAPVTADVLWTLTLAQGDAERPTSHSEVSAPS